VKGRFHSGKQAVFNVMGDLEFEFPCTGVAGGDMVAWGEVPDAVLMHDTNVTFQYNCANTNPQLPVWTINGASEDPDAANTLYLVGRCRLSLSDPRRKHLKLSC